MNTLQLKEILEREHFRADSYDLNVGNGTEQLVLSHQQNGKWTVHYSERGLQTGKREFATESEACEYLLRLLREDPTTR